MFNSIAVQVQMVPLETASCSLSRLVVVDPTPTRKLRVGTGIL